MKTHTSLFVFAAAARWPRVAALAGSLLTASAGATVYYWDGNGSGTGIGGAGTWDLKAEVFRTSSDPAAGSLVAWASTAAGSAEVDFSGTGGVVTIADATTVAVNRLSFLTGGYSLAGASSAVRFVGTAPELSIASGTTVILGTALLGDTLTLGGGGTLALGNNSSLASTMALTIDDGSTLNFSGKSLSLLSSTLINGSLGAAQNENGSLSTTGGVTVESGTLNVKLTGTGGLTKTTAGSVTVGQNKQFTYTGDTRIEAGTLQLSSSSQLSTGSALVATGGTLNMGGFSQGVKALTLAGGSITNGDLSVNGGNSAASLLAGTISATLKSKGLSKSGSGTATLTGSVELGNGEIVVAGGLLDLSKASVSNAGNVAVNAGTFAGSGTYNNVRLDLAGGAIAPGGTQTVGSLSFGGGSKWTNGSSYDFDVFRTASGISTDLLTVSTLDLSALGTGGFTISVDLLAGSTSLLSSTGGTSSFTWTFLTTQDGITGFEASDFTVTGNLAGLFSVTQSGKSLQLTYTSIAVPEPATYAAGLGLATLCFVGVREWWSRRKARC